jgi:hypothetical protein
MHPSRNTGIGVLSAGLAVIAAVLVGDVSTTTSHYWCRVPVIAAIGIGALISALGLWTLGVTYQGWWQPQTHEEKVAERTRIAHEALIAGYARRDAFQELIDELENNYRDLKFQLDDGRTFGLFHPGNAWAKNRHILNGDQLADTRLLVQDAYQRTHALNQRTRERYEAASQDDVNDSEWVKLSDDEVQERTAALEAVTKARVAVIAARDSGAEL